MKESIFNYSVLIESLEEALNKGELQSDEYIQIFRSQSCFPSDVRRYRWIEEWFFSDDRMKAIFDAPRSREEVIMYFCYSRYEGRNLLQSVRVCDVLAELRAEHKESGTKCTVVNSWLNKGWNWEEELTSTHHLKCGVTIVE